MLKNKTDLCLIVILITSPGVVSIFFSQHYYEPHFLTKSRINNSNIFCFNYQCLMGHNETMLSGAEKKNNLKCAELLSGVNLTAYFTYCGAELC